MKLSKWVDMGQEVEIEVDFHDFRSAMNEAFSNVTDDRLGCEPPTGRDVIRALSDVGKFLNAMTDEHIALMNPAQRKIVREFLQANALRFVEVEVSA